MKKNNLKEYVESFDSIQETKIFSKNECKKIMNTLLKRQNEWENRKNTSNPNFLKMQKHVGSCNGTEDGFFMTFGALTYLDAADNVYKEKEKYFNKILKKDFDWMYAKIKSYYKEKFEKPVVYKLGLPGFHIFQTKEKLSYEYARNLATIHQDFPHEDHEWDSDILAVSSFTIAIDLPKCTAGLNIWRDGNIFRLLDDVTTVLDIGRIFFDNLSTRDQIKVTENSEYFPYKLGYMYEQDGLLRHQITVGGDVMENERRVTLQGHMVEIDKEIIIYV